MGYNAVQDSIQKACRAAKRARSDVTLVAVTKTRTAEQVEQLIAAGQTTFGENRVQDAAAKWPALRAAHPGIKLHFIGHLQTNKAKEAVALFDVIESVDSERLAEALAAEMKKQGRNLPCFIQVNTGEEAQKGGTAPKDVPALLATCRAAGLDVRGLMCIPPADEQPDMHFALLNKMAKNLNLPALSMGMSADFDRAIAFGATQIRVGSALFEENVTADETQD